VRSVNKDQDAYVYIHRRIDTDEVFYVGIGVSKRRAWSKHGRNKHWVNVVNKHGFYHEIVFSGVSREDAKEIETLIIETVGRRDLNNGPLVNMTGGGDGHLNPTNEQRRRMSIQRIGTKRTAETRRKMSEAQSRGKHSQAKRVINVRTGKIYECIKDASEDYDKSYHSLKDKLSGRRNCYNDTEFVYYED
jgi:hypothetical protein